jgi:GT2 family glycosyltransferase
MNLSGHVPKVSVIIPNWNTQRWLAGCLNGLRTQQYKDFQIILVDNGSTDDSVAFVEQRYPEVKIVILPTNKGFAAAVNLGIRQSCSDYVALLNVDTVPQPDWLASLVQIMDQSPAEISCLASKMLSLANPDLIDDAGDTLSWYGSARKRGSGQPAQHYSQVEEVFSVCAGAALYRRNFFEDVGDFDENFVSYLEDVDLGLRGRLGGHQYLYVPAAEVWHQSHGAGLARSRYVYLMTRNRLALIFKNIPAALLLKKARMLLFGQFYFFLVYKKPFHSLAGIISFLITLPQILRQRRRIQQSKRVSNQDLEGMLSSELGEPRLRDIIRTKFPF